eukprot:3052779-Amphidinium_carterae.1
MSEDEAVLRRQASETSAARAVQPYTSRLSESKYAITPTGQRGSGDSPRTTFVIGSATPLSF